jgi:two-component system sensor kinase FixL
LVLTPSASPPVLRLLLVSDDPADHAAVRKALAGVRDQSFRIDGATTRADALHRLRQRQHDVYLLAEAVEGRPAADLLRQVGLTGDPVPTIVLTDHGSPQGELDALQAGASYCLAKSRMNTGSLASAIDYATETAASRRALDESEAHTRAVLESAVDGMISIDEHGVIETFNKAAAAIFGYPAEAVIGRNVSLLMPEPYASEHDAYIRRYLRTGQKRVIGEGREVVGRRSDGGMFPLDLAISEVKVHGARRFLGIVRDITERKHVEAELFDAQERARRRERLADIGAITAQIVHDIGNPVAGVVMQANAILRTLDRAETPAIETVRRQVERVLNTSRTLDRMVKSFLDFSREQRLEVTELSLADLLTEVHAAWQPLAAQREISLELILRDDLPPISADADKLRRVLENLLKNAIEAIDPGPGNVDIRAELAAEEPATVRIAFEDTGCGVPEGIDPFRLFETTKPHGTGLGLAIVSQIVQAHGGTVRHCPNSPRGAIFTVELPCRTR